ncbi:MAG: nucleotidyltransferase domain-containing protein [Nanoarchaeota archaeon]
MTNKINKKIVLKKIEENKKEIVKFSVKKIGLFGSVLKGKQKKRSDVDILVEFDNLTFDNYFYLQTFLEKIFKRKVDLVIEDSLRPELNYVKKEAEYVLL